MSKPLATSADYTAVPTRASEWLGKHAVGYLGSLFVPASVNRWPRIGALIALAILGVGHWIWFFGVQPLALDFEDWPKERAYLDVLREALTTRTVPYHMDYELQMTHRYLAIPETPFAPQSLLLPFLSNGQFVTFQTCFMFLVGLAGCWQLARRFDWGAFTLLTFTVVFSFNGFITSRLAVGHFMWSGYYLFPWMLLTVLRLLDEPGSIRRMVEMSWVVFALFLNGSFHLAVWWMMFLVVLALVRPAALLWPVGLSLAMAGALCLFRVAPAAVTFGGVKRTFGTGFPDFVVMMQALAMRLPYDAPWVKTPWIDLGWWEFNHFVGLPALVFTLYFALKPRPADYQPGFNRNLLMIGSGVLAVLSLSVFYALIASLPLPLFNSERITTRFISVAFFVAIFCASDRFNREASHLPRAWQALALALLLQTLIEFALHSNAWRLGALEAVHPPSSYWPNADTLRVHLDHYPKETRYKLTVAVAWAVSAIAFVGTLVAWWRARPATTTAEPATA
jgi:hypothetical protein